MILLILLMITERIFASVTTAEVLLEKEFTFLGVVKTATRKYPMELLSQFVVTS